MAILLFPFSQEMRCESVRGMLGAISFHTCGRSFPCRANCYNGSQIHYLVLVFMSSMPGCATFRPRSVRFGLLPSREKRSRRLRSALVAAPVHFSIVAITAVKQPGTRSFVTRMMCVRAAVRPDRVCRVHNGR